MNDDSKVDVKRWIGFAVAVMMCKPTGENLHALMIRLIPFDLFGFELDEYVSGMLSTVNVVGPLIGYGITGVLLGLCMNYLLGRKAKYFIKWLPLLLFAVYVLSAFLNLFSAGRVADWSVYGLAGLMLTRIKGYAYLFFLPFVCSITIYFLEAKKNNRTMSVQKFKTWLVDALVKDGRQLDKGEY